MHCLQGDQVRWQPRGWNSINKTSNNRSVEGDDERQVSNPTYVRKWGWGSRWIVKPAALRGLTQMCCCQDNFSDRALIGCTGNSTYESLNTEIQKCSQHFWILALIVFSPICKLHLSKSIHFRTVASFPVISLHYKPWSCVCSVLE